MSLIYCALSTFEKANSNKIATISVTKTHFSVPAVGVAPCGWCNMSVAVAVVVYATKNRLHCSLFSWGSLFIWLCLLGEYIALHIVYAYVYLLL